MAIVGLSSVLLSAIGALIFGFFGVSSAERTSKLKTMPIGPGHNSSRRSRVGSASRRSNWCRESGRRRWLEHSRRTAV